jgi:hypothetical protein
MRLMSEGLTAVTWLSSEVCVLKDHGIPIFSFSFEPSQHIEANHLFE